MLPFGPVAALKNQTLARGENVRFTKRLSAVTVSPMKPRIRLKEGFNGETRRKAGKHRSGALTAQSGIT
jgi:hypothetical protein